MHMKNFAPKEKVSSGISKTADAGRAAGQNVVKHSAIKRI